MGVMPGQFVGKSWTNKVFTTNSILWIIISLQPDAVDFRYFKLWILLDQINYVWNIKGSQQYGYKDLGIIKFEFVAKSKFLYLQIEVYKCLNRMDTYWKYLALLKLFLDFH